MRVTVLTYSDPYAALLLSGLFATPGIEVVSVYLSRNQVHKKTSVDLARSLIEKSGVWYLFNKSFEFYSAKVAVFLRDLLGLRARSPYPIRSVENLCARNRLRPRVCTDVNSPAFREALERDAPDVVLCARFNQIIRPKTLAIARRGFLNFHASLLPDYKGLAADIRVLANGETRAGFTVHEMAPELDGGRIVSQHVIALDERCTVSGLSFELHLLGRDRLPGILSGYVDGSIVPRAQPKGGSYGSWPSREEVARFRATGRRYFTFGDFAKVLLG